MRNYKFIAPVIFTFLSLIVVMAAFQMPIVLAAEETSIETADQAINEAFINVLASEKAGANVTQLLITLEVAGQFLANAKNAYNNGNLTNVLSNAGNASQLANQVSDEALTLEESSIALSQRNFWLTLAFSIGGAVAFNVIMFAIWKLYRKHYAKKMLSMRPELVETEH